MDTSQLAVGQRLKFLRKSNKLSGQALGDIIGLTKSAISLIESGTNKLSYEYALTIAQHTNSNVDWLLTGKGEMTGQAAGANFSGNTLSGSGSFNSQAGGSVTNNRNTLADQDCQQQLAIALSKLEGAQKEIDLLKQMIELLKGSR